MKTQYLGDSKDAFKWDYLDYVTSEIGATHLDVVPMATEPDRTGEGKSSPLKFPAFSEVQCFCRHLQKNRNLCEICKLPDYTKKKYNLRLHKPGILFKSSPHFRSNYFMNIPSENGRKRVLFFDPDIGFEPEKTICEKHIAYSDISNIWKRISDRTLVCVFQHGRRMHYPFDQHYKEIKQGIKDVSPLYSTAIYWDYKLMFVLLSKSSLLIKRSCIINSEYRNKRRPVQLICEEYS